MYNTQPENYRLDLRPPVMWCGLKGECRGMPRDIDRDSEGGRRFRDPDKV